MSRRIKIHELITGTVSVKWSHREFSGPASLRFPSILLDRNWTEPMPVRAWLVEHEEGLLLVDTGEGAFASEPSAFVGPDGFFYRKNLRIEQRREEEVDRKIEALGFATSDVRWVVLTHLHSDHVDGLQYFPSAEVILTKTEFEKPFGAYRPFWPTWFAPTLWHGPERDLTSDGRIKLIATPGHTLGHQSVLIEDELGYVLLAGDLSFSQEQFLRDGLPGISVGLREAGEIRSKVLRLAEQRPLVFLPSHDPESGERLRNRVSLR